MLSKKFVLTELAKAIKHIDISTWNVNPGKERDAIYESRKNLINIIFSEGYELTTNYRVIKSKTQRELI